MLRQLNREQNPDVREVVRRFQADYNDFDGLENEFPIIILNNDTEDDLQRNVKEILCQSELHFARGQK